MKTNTKNTMTSIRSVRKEKVKFDVTYPTETPEIFVDGVDSLMVGFPLTKVVFYQTTRVPDGEVSQRQAALRLTMSTANLLEFCKRTLSSYSDPKDQAAVAASISSYQARMKNAFQPPVKVPDEESPVNSVEKAAPVAKKALGKSTKISKTK